MKRVLSIGLVAIGILAVAAGWSSAAVAGSVANIGSAGGFLSVTALVFLVAGALITFRMPRRWTGPLVQVVSLTVALSTARQADLGALSAVNGALWLGTLLLPAVLVFDHPDGIRTRWMRFVLGVAIATTAGLAVPIAITAHGTRGASTTWWYTSAPHGAVSLAWTWFVLHTGISVATLSIVALVMVGRLIKADKVLRRLLDPVWVPGLVWALVTVAGQLARLTGPSWALEYSKTYVSYTALALFLFVVVPFLSVALLLSGVVWIQLVVPRLRRTAAGVAIGAVNDPTEVDKYLATSLGDQSVNVVFRSQSDSSLWVDTRGRPAVMQDESDRAVMVLQRDGVILGAIDFDAALAAEPDAVELGATAAAFALDNARLIALANARTEESRRLISRLVTAGDAVRADLRATLEAGPLQHLADVDLALERGADQDDVARQLQNVTADVREISHGVFPPELTNGGLAAALPHLESSGRRYDSAIEVTVFLAVYKDPHAILRDEVDHLRIELSVTPVEAELLDRVTVLGGTIEGNRITLPFAGIR
jgi:hypothetical protein